MVRILLIFCFQHPINELEREPACFINSRKERVLLELWDIGNSGEFDISFIGFLVIGFRDYRRHTFCNIGENQEIGFMVFIIQALETFNS